VNVAGKVYVDAAEMGAQVGISRSAVLRLARLKRVPYYEVGRRWLFEPSEFMEALRRGAGTTAPSEVEKKPGGGTVLPLRRAP